MSAAASAAPVRRKAKRQRWYQKKHQTATTVDADDSDAGIEMVELVAKTQSLWSPIRSSIGAYDMDKPSDRIALASDLWRGSYFESTGSIREENPVLVDLLETLIENTSNPSEEKLQQFVEGKRRLVDGILVSIVRAQSQKKMPLLTAAIGIVGMCNCVTAEYHDAIASFSKGLTPSEKWLEDFVKDAMELRPEPEPEEMIPGINACVFDNLQIQMDYHSYMVDGESGQLLDMTTWMSCPIPRRLAPNLDLPSLCKSRATNPTLPSPALPRPAR
jgi:hypothetical protein